MSNKEKHWEKTRGLMWTTLAIWFFFGYVVFFFFKQKTAYEL